MHRHTIDTIDVWGHSKTCFFLIISSRGKASSLSVSASVPLWGNCSLRLLHDFHSWSCFRYCLLCVFLLSASSSFSLISIFTSLSFLKETNWRETRSSFRSEGVSFCVLTEKWGCHYRSPDWRFFPLKMKRQFLIIFHKLVLEFVEGFFFNVKRKTPK